MRVSSLRNSSPFEWWENSPQGTVSQLPNAASMKLRHVVSTRPFHIHVLRNHFLIALCGILHEDHKNTSFLEATSLQFSFDICA